MCLSRSPCFLCSHSVGVGGGAQSTPSASRVATRGGGKGKEEKDRERVALGYMNIRVRRVSGESRYWAENNNRRESEGC